MYLDPTYFACKQLLHGRIFYNSRIISANINISDRIRFKTAKYGQFVSKCMKMLNKVSHPFPPVFPIICNSCTNPGSP